MVTNRRNKESITFHFSYWYLMVQELFLSWWGMFLWPIVHYLYPKYWLLKEICIYIYIYIYIFPILKSALLILFNIISRERERERDVWVRGRYAKMHSSTSLPHMTKPKRKFLYYLLPVKRLCQGWKAFFVNNVIMSLVMRPFSLGT